MEDSILKQKIRSYETIYFVCSGNIIRSAFADIYANHLGISGIRSFGTTYHNTTIHEMSKKALIAENIDRGIIDQFEPTHISEIGDFGDQSIFLVMTDKHKSSLLNYGIKQDNIFYTTNLIGKEEEISDPYFNGNYDKTFDTLRSCVRQIALIRSRGD